MKLQDITIGARYRIPATEKNGSGTHYAYVRDIVPALLGGGKIVIVEVPAIGSELAISPEYLQPARKSK